MFVRDYMTQNPITIAPDANFPQAIGTLRKYKIRHLPVVDGGRLVGIVVEKDLLSNQPSPATTLSVYEIYSLLETLRVRQMMTRPVLTVEADCPVEEAARIMISNKISCLPVMEGERLIGIITETDIFKVLVEVLGGDETGMRLTIRLPEQVGALAGLVTRLAQAGGNIIAVVNSSVLDDGGREVMLKEVGVDRETVTTLLHETTCDPVDIRPTTRYQPRHFE